MRTSRGLKVLFAVACVGLGACCRTGSNSGWASRPQKGAVAQLRERADRLWSAKAAEQWATVFEYFEPQERNAIVLVDFVDWSAKNEPFRVLGYSVQNVEVDGDTGWVDIEFQSTIRQFPSVDPRTSVQTEKWRRTDGVWYPVPKNQLDQYPLAPSKRNTAAEAGLRARFDEAWSHRRVNDWAGLYEFADPLDRDFVTLDMYSDAESQFTYLGVTVRWVEVVGDAGQVQVSYYHKVADPSMEKLPPRDALVTERWIRRDGTWYRDLKRS